MDSIIQMSGFEVTTLICGMAKGIDSCGKAWADENKIPVEKFYPDWQKHGLAGGFYRNQEMANTADALIAVHTGSKGTTDMIQRAKKKGLKVFVKVWE
jgi:ABC-type sugar transport system substrate-binding protein